MNNWIKIQYVQNLYIPLKMKKNTSNKVYNLDELATVRNI